MTNNTYFGNSKPIGFYYGTDKIRKLYLGNTLTYEEQAVYLFEGDGLTHRFDAIGYQDRFPTVISKYGSDNADYEVFICPMFVNCQINRSISVDGKFNISCTISCKRNNDVNSRNGILVLRQKVSLLLVEIKIIQAAAEQMAVAPSSFHFSSNRGTKTVYLYPAGQKISVSKPATASWLTYEINNDVTVDMTVLVNLSNNPRQTYLDITMNLDTYRVHVSQQAYGPI